MSSAGLSIYPAYTAYGFRPVTPTPYQRPAHSQTYSTQQGSPYFLSLNNNPNLMGQVNTAASNWAMEALDKFPFGEVLPTWAQAGKMWLQGAQERWSSGRFYPRREDFRMPKALTGSVVRGVSLMA